MNAEPAVVVDGEAPESDEDIDLSSLEATEDLYDENIDDDEQEEFDACEEALEHLASAKQLPLNAAGNSKRGNNSWYAGNASHRDRNLRGNLSNSRNNQSSIFPKNLSASSLRSLISTSKSISSLSKPAPKYPGILHKQLRDKNSTLAKELTDIQTMPYREATVKCVNLREASNGTLMSAKEALNHMKKTRFNLITGCSRLEEALQFVTSANATWAT